MEESGGEYRFSVRDDGRGMSPEELARAVDPFVTDGRKHPRRRVGLGLPFMIQAAEQAGGGWDLRSEKGAGTLVSARFDAGHVDMPPEGDVAGMLRTVLMFEGPAEVAIRRARRREGSPPLCYEIRKSELAEALGGLGDAGALVLLDRYLRSLEEGDPEGSGG